MSLIILDEADDEILELVQWYRAREVKAAERLVALYENALLEVGRDPGQFPLMEMRRNPGNVRRVRLKRYPIQVCYQVIGSDVFVFAVAHTSRKPGYWRKRIQK
jgi:plasmid stabilization system protein ParE